MRQKHRFVQMLYFRHMPAGRPTEPVPQDVADHVISWIADGKTLREFCRQKGNPSYGTVYNWIEKDQQFASRFARAREMGEDVIAQECLEIADDGSNDWETRQNRKGDDYQVPNPELVMRSKLRVETRLKLLAKWNPKRWGDKLEHTGELGIKTVIVQPSIKQERERPALAPSFDELTDGDS